MEGLPGVMPVCVGRRALLLEFIWELTKIGGVLFRGHDILDPIILGSSTAHVRVSQGRLRGSVQVHIYHV